MRTLLVVLFFGLVALAAATTESEYQLAFTLYMKEHQKTYTSGEFATRYAAFKWNYDYVAYWNAQNTSTVLGMTTFADITNEEYQRTYLGTHIDGTEALLNPEEFNSNEVIPDSVDWREKQAVTPVKNQGQCGSCWAFSTTGSVEGAYQIKTGKLVSLSEQNLMDCSTRYGNHGCNGGLMDNAFKYIIANKGIDTEESYPYQTRDGTCHFSAANVGATITSYKNVAAGSEDALATAIVQQPVSVAIDASKNSFQLYKSGIYYEPSCSSSRLDHGVLAVGYGNGFFLVKNSWGTVWGQQGYIQMSRGKNNNCGIATSASYPIA